MLMNLGSSWGWCAEAPTLGKAALARAFKPTVSIGTGGGGGGRGVREFFFSRREEIVEDLKQQLAGCSIQKGKVQNWH